MSPDRPPATEYLPHHQQYVSLIQGPLVDEMRAQRAAIDRLRQAVGEERAGFRYAPNKWSVREVIGHMADAERVHAFRAMTFARGDAIDLPRYDPDGYVRGATFETRTVPSLVDELLAVREASIALFDHFAEEAWLRSGLVVGKPLTVRAVGYIAAGHVQRHLNVLAERYGI